MRFLLWNPLCEYPYPYNIPVCEWIHMQFEHAFSTNVLEVNKWSILNWNKENSSSIYTVSMGSIWTGHKRHWNWDGMQLITFSALFPRLFHQSYHYFKRMCVCVSIAFPLAICQIIPHFFLLNNIVQYTALLANK